MPRGPKGNSPLGLTAICRITPEKQNRRVARQLQPNGSLNSKTSTMVGTMFWTVTVVIPPCCFTILLVGIKRSLVPASRTSWPAEPDSQI